MVKKILLGLIVALIIIQFIPKGHTNPPVTGDVATTVEVKEIIKQSCYDCHSNTTEWPWYSKVAPVSWIIGNHVAEGREHLNFSEWDKYRTEVQMKLANEIEEEIRKGEMPMTGYVAIHSEAELSDTEKEILYAWCKEMIQRTAYPADTTAAATTNDESMEEDDD